MFNTAQSTVIIMLVSIQGVPTRYSYYSIISIQGVPTWYSYSSTSIHTGCSYQVQLFFYQYPCRVFLSGTVIPLLVSIQGVPTRYSFLLLVSIQGVYVCFKCFTLFCNYTALFINFINRVFSVVIERPLRVREV